MGVGAASDKEYPRKLSDIVIRDPFVLVYDGKYYMYGTGASGRGYGCFVSPDLINWSEPVTVFERPEGFDGIKDFWAPECHFYKGSFYLFATYYSSESGKRGTAIFSSESPLGPFKLISDGHVTPKERDCIDGTLYVDGDGTPWIVYVNEWTSNSDGVGEMAAARLSDDLTRIVGEPKVLFRADEPIWAANGVTDGPFVYTTYTGKLIMLWSNFDRNGYVLGMAYSDKITGKWRQSAKPLYRKDKKNIYDGGHGMIFTDLGGKLMISIHQPNDDSEPPRPAFYHVVDAGEALLLDNASTGFEKFIFDLKLFAAKFISFFTAFKIK
ncbi:MAG: glycoside hydrolase family 43 protein [Clostridiales bacterium]|nr:glycoside hydrolase family 43 protein [Clostridiales bacterium]